MPTLRLTILKDKPAKDGSFKIRVAMSHKHSTHYILTRFKVDNESQFKNGNVVRRADAAAINSKLRALLNDYQERVDNIKDIKQYTCKELISLITSRTYNNAEQRTFQTVGSSYVSELIDDKRENYAKLIERNNRYFSEFCNGDIMLSQITPTTIDNYDKYLRRIKKIGETTIGMMMGRTRVIINLGIKRQLVKFDVHPFSFYHIKASPVREVDLPIEVIRKIRDYSPTEKTMRVARDLFMLSFYFCRNNQEITDAFLQAFSYAKLLESSVIVLCDKHSILVYEKEDSFDRDRYSKYYWSDLSNPDTFNALKGKLNKK